MDIQIALPLYRCHKEVRALKIKAVLPGRGDGQGPGITLEFEDSAYAPISEDEEYAHKHRPRVGGYYVIYADGYKSFSPAKAFEDGYTRVDACKA